MERNHFINQMQRLISVYGDRAYPAERVSLLWKECSYLADYEFSDLVSELIGTCGTAPMLGKFRELTEGIRRKHAEKRKSEFEAWAEQQMSCSYCAKTGVVLARKKTDGNLCAFVCFCEIGSSSNLAYPKWTQTNSSLFEI